MANLPSFHSTSNLLVGQGGLSRGVSNDGEQTKGGNNLLRTFSQSGEHRTNDLRTTSGARRRAIRALSKEPSFVDLKDSTTHERAPLARSRSSRRRSDSDGRSSPGPGSSSNPQTTSRPGDASKRPRAHNGSTTSTGPSGPVAAFSKFDSLGGRAPHGTASLRRPVPHLPRDPGDERTLRRRPKINGSPGSSSAAASSPGHRPTGRLNGTGTTRGGNASAAASMVPSSSARAAGGRMGASASASTSSSSSLSSSARKQIVRDQAEAVFIARAKEQAEEIVRLKRIVAEKDDEIKQLRDAVQAAELRAEIAEDLGGITAVDHQQAKSDPAAAESKKPRPARSRPDTVDIAAVERAVSDEKLRVGPDGGGDKDKKKDAEEDDVAPLRERPKNMNRRLSIMALDAKRAEPLLGLGVSRAMSRLDQLDEDSVSAGSSSSATLTRAPPSATGKSFASLSDMVSRLGENRKVLQTPRGGPVSSPPPPSSSTDVRSSPVRRPPSSDGSTRHSLADSGRSVDSDRSESSSWQRGSRSRSASGSHVTMGRARALSRGSSAGGGLEAPDPELLAALEHIVNEDADSQDDQPSGQDSVAARLNTTSGSQRTVTSSEATAAGMSQSNSVTSSVGSGVVVPRVASARWSEALAPAGQSATSSRSSADSGRYWRVAYGSLADLKGDHAAGPLVLEGEAGTAAGLLVHVLDEATGKRDIKAGTKDRLVEMLAPGAAMPDAGYLSDFLLSYTNFMTGHELIAALDARWRELDQVAGDGAGADQDATLAGLRAIVRVRVINVLKKWLEQRPFDFDDDAVLLRQYVDMVRGPVRSESPQWATRLETALQTHVRRAAVLPYLRADPIDAVLAAMKRADAGLVHRGFSSHRKERAFVGSEAVAWLCENVTDLRVTPAADDADSAAPVSADAAESLALGIMQHLLDDKLVAELKEDDEGDGAGAPIARSSGSGAKSPTNVVLTQAAKLDPSFRSSESLVSQRSDREDAARTHLPRFRNRMKFYYFVHQDTDGQAEAAAVGRVPESLVPPDGRHISGCLDLEPLEVARQLTLLDRRLFVKVDAVALQDKALDADANAYVDFFNRVCYWVATEIVTTGALPEERCESLMAFIRVGEHLERMRNYNGLFALIGGLHVSSVNRMRRMWACLQDKHKESHESMERLISLTNPEHNYLKYRGQISQDMESDLPCIPYFGQYLRDLTHIRDGNPDTLLADDQRTHLVNFEKMRLLSRVSSAFAKVQRNSALYQFAPVPVIEKYLVSTPVLSESELYSISIKIEPRSSSSSSGSLIHKPAALAPPSQSLSASYSSVSGAGDAEGDSHPGSSRSASDRKLSSPAKSSKAVSSKSSKGGSSSKGGVSPRTKRKRRGSVSHRVANLFKGGHSKKSETEQRVDELADHWKAMGIVPEEVVILDNGDGGSSLGTSSMSTTMTASMSVSPRPLGTVSSTPNVHKSLKLALPKNESARL